VGKVTGFLELERKDRVYRDPKERLTHYKEFVVPLAEPALSIQFQHSQKTRDPKMRRA